MKRMRLLTTALLTLLLLVNAQWAKADSNQPRFMLPTASMTSNNQFDVSYVFVKNPYFTIYLWVKNSDNLDSYWNEAPTLTVDGHSVKLSHIHGTSVDYKGTYEYVCHDGKKVYYYVHTRTGFKEADNFFFDNVYGGKLGTAHRSDYYVPIDIIMAENKPDEVHRVKVYGKATMDREHTGTYYAKTENNDSVLQSQKTVCPFSFNDYTNSLKWTSPGELTFTSPNFRRDAQWGKFQIVLDNVESTRAADGVISISKDYGDKTDYSDATPLPVEYRFEGVYDIDYSLGESDDAGIANIVTKHPKKDGKDTFIANREIDYFITEKHCHTLFKFSRDAFLKNNGLNILGQTKISLKCLDKKITKVEIINENDSVVAAWPGDMDEGAVSECELTVTTSNVVKEIRITYDRSVNGYPIIFYETSTRAPKTLSPPTNLTVGYDHWAKEITLGWESGENGTITNLSGTYYLYRDGVYLDTIPSIKELTYTDKKVKYDENYQFTVYFHPNEWAKDTLDVRLAASTTAMLTRSVTLSDLEVKAQSDGYKLSWSIDPAFDKRGYMFEVYRRTVTATDANLSAADFAGLEPIGSVMVVNKDSTNYSYTDKVVTSTATYAYMVAIKGIQESDYYTMPTIPDGHPDASHIKSLSASRGTYTDHVHLAWEESVLGQDKLVYTLYRHKIEEGENEVSTLSQAEGLKWDKIATLESSSTSPVCTYDDKTAVGGYYYIYAMVACPNGSDSVFTRKISDGFVRSTGNVYGSITYENGQFAVQGVKVTLQSSATTNSRVFNALRLTGGKGGVHWDITPERMQSYFSGPYSVQMYVRPDGKTDGHTDACLLDMGGQLRLTLGDYDEGKGGYTVAVNGSPSAQRIKADHFTHLTFTYDGNGKALLYMIDSDQLDSIASQTFEGTFSPVSGKGIAVGATTESDQTLNGYVDEVRFFKHQLTVEDVQQNFCHYLGGAESGLVAYWTFDESISTMRLAYDNSKTSDTANENHATIVGGRRTNTETPTPDQLSLYAVTDTVGSYTLRGIPYAGDGTTYSLIPTKGAHKFSPTTRTIYVSPSSLTFDPQNFNDQSSFNVKGVVYYENTTYPVKGCRFRVDNTVVKDEWGNEVLSDENGEYTIPVSIGQHAIYIEKEGHTFLNGGRYPATGLHNFNDSVSHLTFTDMTKAIVAGRVAGGAVEKEKPLGLGLGKANIGAATLTLLTSASVEDARRMNVTLDSEEGIFNSNAEPLYYEQANPGLVKSTAWVGGTKSGTDQVKYITIKTDPQTGEFAVKLPPVPYYISTKVDNNPEASASFADRVLLDCSDILRTQTSTADTLSFDYNTAIVQTYFATPVISVAQNDNGDGAFGDARVPAGEMTDSVYTWQMNDGQLTYNYGYPIFTSCHYYTFEISSYERYFNYDANAEHPVEDRQPSSEGYLTFKNPMVLTADTLAVAQLDSLGRYEYTFQAIEPNEVEPYTQPIDISLTIGDNVYLWNWVNGDYKGGLQCVVLGTTVTGETSVTSAPDALVNILRDPFGSNSYLVWNSGSSTQVGFDIKIGGGGSISTDNVFGEYASIDAATGAPGLYIVQGANMGYNIGGGITHEFSLSVNGGAVWDWSNTKEFQTSADPIYDGPAGDLFIGSTSSLIYGDGRKVMLVNDQAGGFKVGTQEVIATAQRMETEFAYTQDYIINQLIPNFKRLREARLVQVSEAELESRRSSFRNNTDSIIYMTSLKPDDPRFGTNNNDSIVWGDKAVELEEMSWTSDSLCCYGPSYSVFLPVSGKYKDEEEWWDAIVALNSNISLWEYYLALNEEGKVKAFRKKPIDTYSFDSGSSITVTHEEGVTTDGSGSATLSSCGYAKFMYTAKSKVTTSKFGLQGDFTLKINFELTPTVKGGQNFKDSYTLNLKDPVPDNFHQVEIYGATEGYGGIDNDSRDDFGGYVFRQISGQTSRYYEGEERTKYYEPGRHILSMATVQVEVPHIDCAQPVVTGVPAGSPATFELKLSNATLANLTRYIDFKLLVVKDKWGNMAEVTINGQPGVNEYDVALGPDDIYNITLKVIPANNDIIHIDSLHLSFYSVGEPELSDDIYLSAHFSPQAEPVELSVSPTLVNTSTDSTLVLTASGYDINSSILNAVRMQQRKVGTPDWTTIHSWVKGTPAGDTESTLPAERIDTLVDMRSSIFYPDATYEFRAITDCTVSGETAIGESAVITVIKDVTLPKPIYLPEPADGVLGEGDNISITFNEDIYSQSLNEVDNFVIQSVLNTDSVAHDVALLLDGSATPAATSQSQLILGGTSFTLCGWVKSGSTAGTLFRHGEGSNAFRVGIDGDGYLWANIIDDDGVAQTYKATKAIEQDVWSYVAVVYDVDNGTLSAYSASGDNEATLMSDVHVGKNASSQGYIYLGEGLTGAMHELSLFCAPLTWTTIKAQMYLGKSNSTPALIGYWRLDEGHGTKSEDRARSRHILLASANNWYMENENISLALDGTHYAGIPTGGLSVTEGVSYLVEMWAQADEDQPTDAQLFSLDKGQKLDLNIVGGQLQLVADSVTYATGVAVTDHQWHHLALNVLKGASGQASLLVDGVSMLTVPADKVPALAGAYLWLGHNMKGMIDEVRFWHGTNTQETINERMYYRIDGAKEEGLVGYWPMENTYFDEYNQRVFVFSLENKGYQATASTTLVTDAEGVTLMAGSEAPGLKMAPHKSNLDFSFVADERTVSVTLDHSPQALEGCTVSTTLRDYYDLHTNVGTPITWSFVVKQNPLSWNTAEVQPRVPGGQDGTFTATLMNNGAADQQWKFNELPSWLSASPSSGTIFANGSQEVTFTVKSGNAIGKYFATVSASGNKDIDTPLDICLTVEGDKPDWQPKHYGSSMVVVGQIKIDGIVSTDPEDMVGAFFGIEGETLGECIGVGQPKYNANKDAYYVTMIIYGTSAMNGQGILFRLYDASTGQTYPLTVATPSVVFKEDDSLGSSSNPVIWENEDKQLQMVHFWVDEPDEPLCQWVSLFLAPETKDLSLFNPVVSKIQSVEVSPTESFTYSNNDWSGTYSPIKVGQMMKVTVKDNATLPVVGVAVDPADYPDTLRRGANWIGVPSSSFMTIDEAFAGLAPEEEDMVKSQTEISIYENGKWEGSLQTIEPGMGYIYNSMSETEKTFTFPSAAVNKKQVQGTRKGISANFKYGHNMVAICSVHDEAGMNLPVAAIKVYDAMGELRGRAAKVFRDSLYLLIISGDIEGEELMLRADLNDDTETATTRRTPDADQIGTVISFKRDHLLGRLRSPLVLQASEASDISDMTFDADSQLTVYSISGLMMYKGKAAQFDRNKLSDGSIYIIRQTTTDGRVTCHKVRMKL